MFNLAEFINTCKECLQQNSEKSQQEKIIALFSDTLSTAEKRTAFLNVLKDHAQDKFPDHHGVFVLEQSETMFLSIFTLAPGIGSAIHDHGLWTAVATLQGSSECKCYTIDDHLNLTPSSTTLLTAGKAYILDGPVPHSVFNPTHAPTIELHFYPGNVVIPEIDERRNMWHPVTLAHEPYDLQRTVAISQKISLNRVSDISFIFVHGAFQGRWVWDRIKPAILAAGHNAFFPTLKGLAERADELSESIGVQEHIDEICQLIDRHALNNVVLIGHSYGGMVITGVAAQLPAKIRRLVYLDALIPDNHQSALDILGSEATQSFFAMATKNAGWRIDPFSPSDFGLTESEDINWAVPKHTAQSLKTFTDKISTPSAPASKYIVKTFIHCTQSGPIMQTLADKAHTQGWECVQIHAPHCPMITHPELTFATLNSVVFTHTPIRILL